MIDKKYLTAVNVLIAINVLVFILNEQSAGQMVDQFALYFPKNPNFQVWQLVTHMFMHGGFTHLLFNMFGLFMFGTALERIWGVSRFLNFYFLAGIGAAVFYIAINTYQFNALYQSLIGTGINPADLQTMLNNSQFYPSLPESKSLVELFQIPMVGASGAIYGVLVAFAFIYPNTKLLFLFLPVPIAAKYFVPAILSLDLFSGVTGFSIFGGGVAHFAHIGGAIIGFLLMMYWKKNPPRVI